MSNHDEQSPLLQHNSEQDGEEPRTIEFSKEDEDNPRAWPRSKKLTNIAVVAMMASKDAIKTFKLASADTCKF